MKDSDSTGRSNKKANGRTTSKYSGSSSSSSSSSSSPNKGSGTAESKRVNKPTKKAKAMMGGINSRETKTTDLVSNRKNSSSGSSSKNNSPRKGNKQSPKLRPRRRASQTYFFKYQLAKNPLKAEEEDLKLALLASLQQCTNGTSGNDDVNSGKSKNNKLLKSDPKPRSSKNEGSVHSANGAKRPVGRPPKKTKQDLSIVGNGVEISKSKTKKDKFTSSKKGQQYKICANSTSTHNGNKRRGSVESSLSSRESNFKDDEKKVKKKKKKFNTDSLLANCSLQAIDRNAKTEKPRSKISNSLSSCNDPTSVQNKIKKAKKLLQNKEANKIKSAAIIGKYTALKKFPSNSNSSSPTKRRGESLLSPCKNNADKSKSKTKLINCYQGNNLTSASPNSTSKSQYFMPYSPYTPLQMKEPPDEDYLKKYKPETEDFLTFICFRTTAPNFQNRLTNTDMAAMNGVNDNSHTPTINSITNNDQIIEKSNDLSLKQCSSSLMKLTNLNNSPLSIDHCSPNNHRRPIRQSPRLASSSRKISENDSSNHNMGTTATAYDNSITYEEDMKRASIALEDMAQEINSSDNINDEVAQNSPDCISKSSSSYYKNNKHLVKGLMTREFAGAFADEETIFESISNHKL